ncbi:MAG: hypothetical protein RLO81_03205 [Fulvivirga sp.]|uniref:hypothetical protein n=1 Tax=Fulvivirga sp. TaxID=1931237 RepID=UPI0032EDD9EA
MNKNEEIEKTLASLDAMDKVHVKPFFYTRLEARLERKTTLSSKENNVGWALLIGLVILNVGIYFNVNYKDNGISDIQQLTEMQEQYYPVTESYYALIEEYETE